MGNKRPGDVLVFTKHTVIAPDLTREVRDAAVAEYIKSDIKGDLAGHDFHGNRYTGGIGGGAPSPALVKTALTRYSEGGYALINDKLRGTQQGGAHEGPDWEHASQYIKAIDSTMKPTEAPVTVYRAITGSAVVATIGDMSILTPNGIDESKLTAALPRIVGTQFKDNGFISTSYDETFAGSRLNYEGSGHVLLAIDVPVGTPAVDMNMALGDGRVSSGDHSMLSLEHELLLGRGQTFRVDSVSESTAAGQYFDDTQHTMVNTSYPVHVLHLSLVPSSGKAAPAFSPGSESASDRFVWDAGDFEVIRRPA